ncbi:MAG: hypothetical protein QOF70_5761, partial [Acetobacteraceae bacterium]|nr:hypothetical protein [Acetobacteraceae bacterium]
RYPSWTEANESAQPNRDLPSEIKLPPARRNHWQGAGALSDAASAVEAFDRLQALTPRGDD